MCNAGGLWYIFGLSGQGEFGARLPRPRDVDRSIPMQYLFAYHIEALVPTGPPGPNSQREPQRLNRNRDVQFFSVGTLNDRTLIIYMKKKGVSVLFSHSSTTFRPMNPQLDSVFRVLEPVTEKIAEKTKTATFGRNIFGTQKSEWFREYKVCCCNSTRVVCVDAHGWLLSLC